MATTTKPRKHKYGEQRGMLLDFPSQTGWKPPEELPVLQGRIKRAAIDFETTGVDIHGKDVPVGLSVYTEDGRNFYLPWGHASGNLDKDLCVSWAQQELRGLTLSMAESRMEIGMGRKIGVDFEKMGCKIREIQFKASLLDDHRRSVKLDTLGEEFIGIKKLGMMGGKIADMPAADVGPYAERDTEITWKVDEYLEPLIRQRGLSQVAQLEDDLVYCTLYMERNGAPLDLPKLDRWRKEVRKAHADKIHALSQALGFAINPDSGKDMARMFRQLGISYFATEKGQPSFKNEYLAPIAREHPIVNDARLARSYNSLLSKYLDKYWNSYRHTGVMRYKLHQLKGDDYGTVSGRYSSASDNIQQVFDPERQAEKLGVVDWLVRELFVPPPGRIWFKADASQIEFRLFAHYSQSGRLIQAYLDNPHIDFHQQVAELISRKRKFAKNINFGKLYGMGVAKMARQMGVSLEEAQELLDAYEAKFPEARRLMNRAMDLAKKRGFVKTILGRIATFPDGQSLHKALNRVIQGAAADVLKVKLLEVYNHREEFDFNMRFTVHDEIDGDISDESVVPRIKELLEAPVLGIRVPLVWECETGPNWNFYHPEEKTP